MATECQERAHTEADSVRQPQLEPPAFKSSECVGRDVVLNDTTVSETACECVSDAGKVLIGPKGLGCAAVGRVGACLSDNQSFAGCSVGVTDSCVAACQALQQARQDDAAKMHQVEIVDVSCITGICYNVLRIDGKCYANRSYLNGQAQDCP